MFKRVYNGSTGKVAENKQFSVYIYHHPRESRQERWHVHFVRKSDRLDVKISLWDFGLMRKTQFDRLSVKVFVEWTYFNRHFLRRKWVQNVLKPYYQSMKEMKENRGGQK